MKELLENLYKKHEKELKNNFDDAQIIVWTKDKVLFGRVKGSDVKFNSGIGAVGEILEFRLFDKEKELYFWGDGSRIYKFGGDEISSNTFMLGKVVECKNGWSKVDDGRGGKFYLPLEKQLESKIEIQKYDIIGYHKETHQAYISGYAIKEIK